MPSLIIGSDHRGYDLRMAILDFICPDNKDIKYDIGLIQNCKPHGPVKVDYPDIVKEFASSMPIHTHGILICGSGFGVSTAANRYKHIRATPCRTSKDVEMARRHGDINVLCLGADFTTKRQAGKLINTFFTTRFEGGRHKRRIQKLNDNY